MVVEVQKPIGERGYYINPELGRLQNGTWIGHAFRM